MHTRYVTRIIKFYTNLISSFLPPIMVIVFWDFIFYQIFLLPQVMRSAVISNKNGIKELPYKLLSNVRFRILENYEISEKKCQDITKLWPDAQSFYQNKILLIIAKNNWQIELFP